MTFDMSLFGQAIKHEREHRKVTIEELSKKLSITKDELVYIENGGLDINFKTVLSTMDILEIKSYEIDADFTTAVRRHKLKELLIEAERIGFDRFMETLRTV